MTCSLHKIITLSFLSLYALQTLNGSYFSHRKQETRRHEDELTWQETQNEGNCNMNKVNAQLRERSRNWTQTPTCRSEKELENALVKKPWKRSKTGIPPALPIFNFITAKKLTEKFANRPYSAADIRDTVAKVVQKHHPSFDRKDHVKFITWYTIDENKEKIAQIIAKERTMAPKTAR